METNVGVLASTNNSNRQDENISIVKIALDYLRGGYVPVPLNTDGSKRPLVKWAVYPKSQCMPTEATVTEWFYKFPHAGIGLLMGVPYAECIDCDAKGDADKMRRIEQFIDAVREEFKHHFYKFSIVATPSGGYHIYYKCKTVEGNQVLAATKDGRALIETRGRGGLTVAPESPASVHALNKRYMVYNHVRVLSAVEITESDRKRLFDLARHLNEFEAPSRPPRCNVLLGDYDTDSDPTRPGSIYNRYATWERVLEPHGWDLLFCDGGGNQYWRRPDKPEWAHSAVVYGNDKLYVFSSSAAPLSQQTLYSKFAAYAMLSHEGDFAAAASAAYADGFNTVNYGEGYSDQEVAEACIYRGEIAPLELPKVKSDNPPTDTADSVREDARKPEAVPQIVHNGFKSDPIFSYLWQGNAGRYLTDEDRAKRIEETKAVLECIPPRGYFRNYLTAELPTTDSPVWFQLATAISLAAQCINREAVLREGNRSCYPNLWIGVLGDSSVRKSEAIKAAKRYLRDDLLYGNVMADSFTWASIVEEMGIEFDASGFLNKDKEGGMPSLSTVMAECQKWDTVGSRFFNKGTGYMVFSEVKTFLENLGKSHSSEAKATITDWYDCPAYHIVKTKTAGNYYIYRPFVNILAASTPAWLASGCDESDRISGFLPRWLFFYRQEPEYYASFSDSPNTKYVDEVYADLHRLKEYRGDVKFSSPAMDAYNKWYHTFIDFKGAGDSAVKAWLHRMSVSAKKLAIIFNATGKADRVINEDDVYFACNLISRLKEDLMYVLENELAVDKEDKDVKSVLRLIRNAESKSCNRSELMTGAHLSARRLDQVKATLTQSERVTIEYPHGRRGEIWHLVT